VKHNRQSWIGSDLRRHKLINAIAKALTDADTTADVNIVDKETNEVEGLHQLSTPEEFPAGETPDNPSGAGETSYNMPRQAEGYEASHSITRHAAIDPPHHTFKKDRIIKVYELEYKLSSLKKRYSTPPQTGQHVEDSIQQQIWKWTDELRSLLAEGINALHSTIDFWVRTHDGVSAINVAREYVAEIDRNPNKRNEILAKAKTDPRLIDYFDVNRGMWNERFLTERGYHYGTGEFGINPPFIYTLDPEPPPGYAALNPGESFASIEELLRKEVQIPDDEGNGERTENIKDANYALNKLQVTGNIGNDMATFMMGLNTAHNNGAMIMHLGSSMQLLDDLSSGKYIPKWDTELKKIAKMKNAEIGQGLSQLTTERETGKTLQTSTEPARWNESYHNTDQFEDADLKLGESETDDVDPLSTSVSAPYSDGIGALNSRYEDASPKQRNIVLHATEQKAQKTRSMYEWQPIDVERAIAESEDNTQDSGHQGAKHYDGSTLGKSGEARQKLADKDLTGEDIIAIYEYYYKIGVLDDRKVDSGLSEYSTALLNEMRKGLSTLLKMAIEFMRDKIYAHWAYATEAEIEFYRSPKEVLYMQGVIDRVKNIKNQLVYTGNVYKDMATFSIALETQHSTGPMSVYLDEWYHIDKGLLDKLAAGAYITQWDRELKRANMNKQSDKNGEWLTNANSYVDHAIQYTNGEVEAILREVKVKIQYGEGDAKALEDAKELIMSGVGVIDNYQVDNVLLSITKLIDLSKSSNPEVSYATPRILEHKLTADDKVKDQKDYRGIKVDVEWPKGSIRSYEGDDTYVTHMKCDYGYAKGIEGTDADSLDVYLGDADADVAFVVEQLTEDGNYDEDKIMLGFASEEDAADMYLQHMPAYMLGDIRSIPVDTLIEALYSGPEDRRGEEDLVPSEEMLKAAHLAKVASYRDYAEKVLTTNGGADILSRYIDFSKITGIDNMVNETVRVLLTNKTLVQQLEPVFGKIEEKKPRPIMQHMEDMKKGPGGTQRIPRTLDDIIKEKFPDFEKTSAVNDPSKLIHGLYENYDEPWSGKLYRHGPTEGDKPVYYHTNHEGAEFYGPDVKEYSADMSGKTIHLNIEDDKTIRLITKFAPEELDDNGNVMDVALGLEKIMPKLKEMGYDWAVIEGETGSDVSGAPVEVVDLRKVKLASTHDWDINTVTKEAQIHIEFMANNDPSTFFSLNFDESHEDLVPIALAALSDEELDVLEFNQATKTAQTKTMLILRGVSGSGKSTYAKKIQSETPGSIIVSADDYFAQLGRFDGSKLSAAHTQCLNNAIKAMTENAPLVIIDNTNTQKWEYQKYIDAANKYGYSVQQKMIGGLSKEDVELYSERNIHGVPRNTIERMVQRFEPDKESSVFPSDKDDENLNTDADESFENRDIPRGSNV
jgi:predicted kinase